ncbi:hypothetical protein DXG01_012101, partial [Tephrocybe rancida]
TSLYIPGFDPQPVSADILGVDGQGRTTWALHQGALTGTFDEASFPGTATLVEGADVVSFTYADPGGAFTVGRECSLSGGLAICSATLSGEAVTETETASPFVVQVGTAAAPSTPTVPTSTGVSQPSAPGSSAQTSKNTSSAPTPTHTSKSATVLPPFFSGLVLSAVAALLLAL